MRLTLDLHLPLERFELAVGCVTEAGVTGVFGPSGAGKSRLLAAIAGIEPRAAGRIEWSPTGRNSTGQGGGEVWLDSSRSLRLPPERRRIGLVPQEGLLFPHLDVRGNLLAGVPRRRRGEEAHRERFAAACRILELEPLLERAVDGLSGGERRRVALGRAICSDPALLLLDEPLAALDLALRRRLLPYLRRLRDELAIPMLLVSHDPGEIQALAESVLVLDRGRQVAFGPARSVLASAEVVGRSRELGWNNVLPARVLAVEGAGRVALGGIEALALTTPPLRSPAGASILVGLPSHEILLATVRPVGLSARNVLPATVVEVQHGPDLEAVVVRLDPSLPDLVVDVTEAARDDLALAPGREIWVIVKAAGVEVYEEAQPPAAASDPAPPQHLA